MKLSKLTILILGLLFIQAVYSQQDSSSIRNIDFTNFEFSGKTYGEYKTPYPEDRFALHNGKYGDWRYGMTLEKTLYGDVTGDGEEEAILVFFQETDGSAGIHSVYIYSLEHQKPNLLWAFMTGDRSHGGLRRVFVENGKLVTELFGKETHIEGESATVGSEASTMCCPKSYTRTRYQWRGNQFQQVGEMEVEKNPAAETQCPTCLPIEN